MSGNEALKDDPRKGAAQASEGSTEGKTYVCQKWGETVPASDDISCLYPKEKCKFRLTCPIYAIGKMR